MATTTVAAALNTPVSELRPAKMDSILVITDDSALRGALHRLFSQEGYGVEVVPHSVASLEKLRQRPSCAVILDLQHPGSSGWDLCRKIANSTCGLPLVVLVGSLDVVDKVLLLEMGADDYVTVPFSPRELVARMRALMRRASRVSPENSFAFEDVIVDFFRTEITRGGKKIPVTAKEFKTLEFFTKNAERVISRDELLNDVGVTSITPVPERWTTTS